MKARQLTFIPVLFCSFFLIGCDSEDNKASSTETIELLEPTNHSMVRAFCMIDDDKNASLEDRLWNKINSGQYNIVSVKRVFNWHKDLIMAKILYDSSGQGEGNYVRVRGFSFSSNRPLHSLYGRDSELDDLHYGRNGQRILKLIAPDFTDTSYSAYVEVYYLKKK